MTDKPTVRIRFRRVPVPDGRLGKSAIELLLMTSVGSRGSVPIVMSTPVSPTEYQKGFHNLLAALDFLPGAPVVGRHGVSPRMLAELPAIEHTFCVDWSADRLTLSFPNLDDFKLTFTAAGKEFDGGDAYMIISRFLYLSGQMTSDRDKALLENLVHA